MKQITILLLIFLGQYAIAQNAGDALRYAQQDMNGTARFMGVGGAMGALGTDYSVLSSNPAGLATFRKSEFLFTPSVLHIKSTASLQGAANIASDETNTKFKLNNVGLVFHTNPARRIKWKSFNFGLGYNQTANYNRTIAYEGNTSGSLAQGLAEEAEGLTPEQLSSFGSGLAYETGAIYDFYNTNQYATDFDGLSDVPVFRNENNATQGSMNELVLSFAGNYDNRLMLGATIGRTLLNWEQERSYSEADNVADEIPFFRSLGYGETIDTEGKGVNAKVGLIYRINQMVRLGAAVHTPTAFKMTDRFEAQMTYDFIDANTNGPFNANSDEGVFSYRLRTPWKYQVSGAVLIKKMGFVSAEIEYIDYSTSKFNYVKDNAGNDFSTDERAVNNSIANNYKPVLNFKLGAEYVYDFLQFRAGYNINGSPFVENKDTNNAVSLGMGLRRERFYVDAAYRLSTSKRTYQPYTTTVAPQPVVDTELSKNDFILTLGFRF